MANIYLRWTDGDEGATYLDGAFASFDSAMGDIPRAEWIQENSNATIWLTRFPFDKWMQEVELQGYTEAEIEALNKSSAETLDVENECYTSWLPVRSGTVPLTPSVEGKEKANDA